LCSVAPSAHVREDTSPNKVTPVENSGGYNFSTMMESSEEPNPGLSNDKSIFDRNASLEQKAEESSEVVRNSVTAKPEPAAVSFVSGSTQAVKEDREKVTLHEVEKDDSGSVTSSNNDINSSYADRTDLVVLQKYAGIDTINTQLIAGDITKKDNESNLSQPIVTASLHVDRKEKALKPGGDYSMEVQADKNTSNGDEKTVSANMDSIPPKYNLDAQLEKVAEISKYNFMSWDNVDNQSFVLQTGPGDYYLIVLSSPSNKLMFSETIEIPDTNAMVKPGFNNVIVRGNGFKESYIINRIYKFKDYQEVKAIKAQLSRETNKAGVDADKESTGNSSESVSIPKGARIYAWQMIDKRNVIIRTYFYGDFKATLAEDCPKSLFKKEIRVEAQWPYEVDEHSTIILSNGDKCRIQKLVPFQNTERFAGFPDIF